MMLVLLGFGPAAHAQAVRGDDAEDFPATAQPYDTSQPTMTGNFYTDLGGAPPPAAVADEAPPPDHYGVKVTKPSGIRPSTKRYSIIVR